jgi:hypothetical protein
VIATERPSAAEVRIGRGELRGTDQPGAIVIAGLLLRAAVGIGLALVIMLVIVSFAPLVM